MTCDECQPLLDPYADGELDLVTTLDVERHIHQCDACQRAHRGLVALHASVASVTADGSLYHRAPAALRDLIRSQLPVGRITPARRAPAWPKWAGAAAAIAVTAALTFSVLHDRQPTGELALAQEVVAGHVRSLMATHLFDVESTDRHTVKPWFDGKLDFAPDVRDFAPQSFPLKGGRLDYLDHRPVAALVYGHDKHDINLFTWPAADAAESPATFEHRKGYVLGHWTRAGMEYWAISDTAEETLRQFAAHSQAAAPASAPR